MLGKGHTEFHVERKLGICNKLLAIKTKNI